MEIILKNNYKIIIDDEDCEKIVHIRWHINKSKKSKMLYARATNKFNGIYMHRLIMGIDSSKKIDHINGNGLDNRKENLRIATHQENNYNKKFYINNKLGYKGVRKDKRWDNKYIATITHNAKTQYIGIYDNIEDAARAYDKKAIELFGKFAYLNYPERNYNE